MLDEFQKSIKAVLYSRLTSPLTGTLFFSWLVWNWQLVYYIISGDNTRNIVERIEYIENNFSSLIYTILFPVLSAIFLIFIYPYTTVFVYKTALKFKQQKRDAKNKIEQKQLLTFKESIEIKDEIEKQEEKFRMTTKNQISEIKKLKQEIKFYKSKIDEPPKIMRYKNIKEKNEQENNKKSISDKKYEDDFLKFKDNKYSDTFIKVTSHINSGYRIYKDTADPNAINYFVAINLIEMIKSGEFKITEKGKYFLKKLYEENK